MSEEDNMLRHMLGVFFPLYAAYGGVSQQSLGLSVLPTLHALMNTDPGSPLSEVDVDQVASFLIRITSSDVVTRKTGDADEKVPHISRANVQF